MRRNMLNNKFYKYGEKVKDGNLTVMNTLGTLLSFEELAGWYSICDVRTIIYED